VESPYQTEAEIESVVQGLESCTTGKDDFPHRKHLVVAVWYLRHSTVEAAFAKMRASLLRFLEHHGLDRGIYKEELTRAWIDLVQTELDQLDPTVPLVTATNTIIERLTDVQAVFDRYPNNLALKSERKMRYQLIERTPTVEEYNRVRQAAGLSVKDPAAAKRGLANTLFAACVVHEETVVGIGRVIGDGGLFYDVVDIAVVPEHQKQGVGQLIMTALMKYIDANALPSSVICLMSNKGVAPFYEKFGFKARDADMPGMMIRK
jgi:GNAT superfamily N-acetyltransferase